MNLGMRDQSAERQRRCTAAQWLFQCFQLKRNLEREKDRDAAVRLRNTADALLHPK